MTSRSIHYHFQTLGLKVYSDLMLERMFFNLMENSQRHGGNVRNIWIDVEDRGSSKVIVYRDDGKGIPQEDKERIFQMGFGSNTGSGPICCEGDTGHHRIDHVERGIEGQGVRFEIEVPRAAGSSRRGPFLMRQVKESVPT